VALKRDQWLRLRQLALEVGIRDGGRTDGVGAIVRACVDRYLGEPKL
jgi:hypothetical protein